MAAVTMVTGVTAFVALCDYVKPGAGAGRIRGCVLSGLTSLRLRLGCLSANSVAHLPAHRPWSISQGQLEAMPLLFGDGFLFFGPGTEVTVSEEAARDEHHGPSRPEHQQR